MLKSLIVAIVAVVALSAAPRVAQAGAGYPWCANYSTGLNECNFYTLEQCRVALSGIGGVCSPNLRFRGELPPERKYLRWYWW